jgi:hypothetical protein
MNIITKPYQLSLRLYCLFQEVDLNILPSIPWFSSEVSALQVGR